jgi:ankyrin repeat protein
LTDKVPLIFLACASGNVEHCKIIIEHEVPQNVINLISPLVDADKEILLEFGKKQTPLHLACRKGHTDIVKLLLKYHAVSNLQDEEGNTALHYAINMESADCLLSEEYKTNPNIPNRRGQTPLHVAAAKGNVGIIDLLIRHGADQDILDDQGQTAFHFAAANGHSSVILILLRQNETFPEKIKQDVPTVKEISDGPKNQSPTKKNDKKETHQEDDLTKNVSQEEVKKDEEEVIQKFEINQPDYKGNTALHLAAMAPNERCSKVLQVLLENGADPNRTNWFGYTALHLFCSHQSGPATIIDAFVSKNYDKYVSVLTCQIVHIYFYVSRLSMV